MLIYTVLGLFNNTKLQEKNTCKLNFTHQHYTLFQRLCNNKMGQLMNRILPDCFRLRYILGNLDVFLHLWVSMMYFLKHVF